MQMHRRFQRWVGGGFLLVSVLLESIEMFKVVRELIPESWAGKISQTHVVAFLLVGLVLLSIGKHEPEEDSESDRDRPINNSSSAAGNKIEQHFHFPDAKPESQSPVLQEKPEHLVIGNPIEQTWGKGNSTAYWFEVTNVSTNQTIIGIRAEVVKIDPPQTHLNWPVPLVVKHSQGKFVRDSTSLNAGQPGAFDLVSAHRGGPISIEHTVPEINKILHEGSLFRITVRVTGENTSPVTKQFDVWQDARGFLKCVPV